MSVQKRDNVWEHATVTSSRLRNLFLLFYSVLYLDSKQSQILLSVLQKSWNDKTFLSFCNILSKIILRFLNYPIYAFL